MPVVTTTLVDSDTHLVCMDDASVNALTMDMIDELSDAIRKSQEGGALVLAGRPGCLSAGLDRMIMMSGDRAAMSTLLRRVTQLYDQMLQHPTPIVIACTGHALAAGALLLLVSDLRIGTNSTCQIGFNEARIGLPLGPLAVAAARARLAPDALLQATLLGVVYDSPGALSAGFLDEVVDEGEVISTALERASMLAKLDRRSYSKTRELLFSPITGEVEAALARRRSGTRLPESSTPI